MKKKLVLALLAIFLVLAVVGGGVYGNNHKAWGNKLVGFGQLGIFNIPGYFEGSNSLFHFTNPDCDTDIAINKVSVISSNGAIVYEGPYVKMPPPGMMGPYEVVNIIRPHEMLEISLPSYIWTGAIDADPTNPGNWLPISLAVNQSLVFYTVEISWEPVTRKGATVPLAGWVDTRINQGNPTSHSIMLRNDMKNLTQR